MILNGKDSEDSLLYDLCCAVRYMQTKNIEKCSDKELKIDLPNQLFLSLKAIKRKSYIKSSLSGFWKAVFYNEQNTQRQINISTCIFKFTN